MRQQSDIFKERFYTFSAECKVWNTRFCFCKLSTRLMFHWKAFFILSLFFIYSLLLLQGDIESNPGGRKSKNHLPLFCHWNLNGLPAHNISKMLILKAYNAIYKYDFICLSETYFYSSIPSDHISLESEGYKLVLEDHPNNVKRGRVCIYYQEYLPVRVTNLFYLQDPLLLELNDKNKKNNYIKSLSLSQLKRRRIWKVFKKRWTSLVWHQCP